MWGGRKDKLGGVKTKRRRIELAKGNLPGPVSHMAVMWTQLIPIAVQSQWRRNYSDK